MERELASLREGRDTAAAGNQRKEELLAATITELAERLNSITRKLTARPSSAAAQES
jgi:hypothetical protein